jgi:hypothetical protein
MRIVEKLAPAGALTAALISITCCLPFSVPAALGLAGLSMFASQNQLWLIIASLSLLVVGVIQLVRRRSCQRPSRASIAVLSVSAAIVLVVVFFPERMAAFLADHLP